jgi:hypothetical protein
MKTLLVTKELHTELKVACAARGVTIQAATEQAIRDLLAKQASGAVTITVTSDWVAPAAEQAARHQAAMERAAQKTAREATRIFSREVEGKVEVSVS